MERFHQQITTAVYRAARRWHDLTPAILEELVQETYLKLCDPTRGILSKFVPRHPGSGAGFVCVVATNLVNDHFKSVHTQKHGDGMLEPLTNEEEPTSPTDRQGSVTDVERDVLLGQIDRYLDIAASGPMLERDRQVFWYYYRHGMSAREIAQVPGIDLTAKWVESAIYRLTKLIRECMVKEQLARRGKADETRESGFRIAESL